MAMRAVKGVGLGLALLLAGCSGGVDIYDPYDPYSSGLACSNSRQQPGVVVDFISSLNGGVVPVNATGTLRGSDGYTETMVAWDTAAGTDGRTISLAGAFNRAGQYTVSVTVPETGYQFSKEVSVTLGSDGCGILPQVISLPLALNGLL